MANPELIIDFIEEFLTLDEDFIGQPFKLLDWQKDFIRVYYGSKDGVREFSTAVLEIPRKNGKTQLCAALAVAGLAGLTGSPKPEVVCAASTRKQANVLFDKAAGMITRSKIADSFIVQRSKIICKSNGGVFASISAEAGGAHGMNLTDVICDELHVWKGTYLWTALVTSSATRDNFNILGITTAGFDPDGLLGTIRKKGLKFRHQHNGKWVEGPKSSSLYVYYGPEAGEVYDHTDYDAFVRHNPSHSIQQESAFHRTVNEISEAEARQLYHNEWLVGTFGWMPRSSWMNCLDSEAVIPEGSKISVGVDASRTGDSTAISIASLSDPIVELWGLWEKPTADDTWILPMEEVTDKLRYLLDNYEVAEILFDRYWIENIMQTLEHEYGPAGKGLDVQFTVYDTNSPSKMSPALAKFYMAAMSGELVHNGDIRLIEHVTRAAAVVTPKGVVVEKPSEDSKIDALISSVLAWHSASYMSKMYEGREATGEIWWF